MPRKTTKHPASETSPPNEAGTVSANSSIYPNQITYEPLAPHYPPRWLCPLSTVRHTHSTWKSWYRQLP